MTMNYQTNILSFTGKYLYSDQTWTNLPSPQDNTKYDLNVKTTTLNKIENFPIFGMIISVAKIALAIFHCSYHLIQAAKTKNMGHLYHARKGGLEILRALIVLLPIVGRIYVWKMGPPSSPDALKKPITNGSYVFLMRLEYPGARLSQQGFRLEETNP